MLWSIFFSRSDNDYELNSETDEEEEIEFEESDENLR